MENSNQTRWVEKFMEAYRMTGNVTASAQVAGCGRSTVYLHRESHPEFAEAMDAAKQEAIESLEYEAWKRAKASSDTLLIFLLKSLKPEVYREKIEHHITWEDKAIQDIRAGRITYQALAQTFDDSKAAELFRLAGVPVE